MRKTMVWITLAFVGWFMVGLGSAQADDKVRSEKRDTVSVRWISTGPAAGYEAMTLDRGRTVYVAQKATLSGSEITEAKAIETREGKDVSLTLTGPAAVRFGEQWEKHRGDSMAIVSGSRLVSVGEVSFNAASSAILMSGLSPSHAARVTQLWGEAKAIPGGPAITVVASRRSIAPGDVVSVDVFVSGVLDLRVYQVTLEIEGGTSGTLSRQQAIIDTSRSDYVFRDQQKLDAADQTMGRLGGVLFGKGVNATQRSYLGAYDFVASPDAAGEFTLRARTDASTILMDSNNQLQGFVSNPVTIRVGDASRTGTRDK